MKISVIIPTYKPKEYIWDCLFSILNQTFPEKEFELIIILNGEKEPFYSNLLSFLEINFKHISYQLLYSEWGNVSNARNIGLDNASGEYIAFIDDDDIISPNYLEELLNNSSKYCVAVSNTLSFKSSFDDCFKNYFSKQIYKALKSKETNIFKRRAFLSPVAFKLIHKDIISSTRYDTSFRNGQDSIFMFEISNRIKSIRICSNTYYYVRFRCNSAYHTQTLKMRCIKMIHSTRKYTQIYIPKFWDYNFLLYLSRIIASILCIIRYK